jgi:hypothetical protein
MLWAPIILLATLAIVLVARIASWMLLATPRLSHAELLVGAAAIVLVALVPLLAAWLQWRERGRGLPRYRRPL